MMPDAGPHLRGEQVFLVRREICVHSSKFAVPAPSGHARLSTWMPGSISSQRMMPEMEPPISPATIAKIRYSVPMSLWFVDMNQRTKKVGLCASAERPGWTSCAE